MQSFQVTQTAQPENAPTMSFPYESWFSCLATVWRSFSISFVSWANWCSCSRTEARIDAWESSSISSLFSERLSSLCIKPLDSREVAIICYYMFYNHCSCGTNPKRWSSLVSQLLFSAESQYYMLCYKVAANEICNSVLCKNQLWDWTNVNSVLWLSSFMNCTSTNRLSHFATTHFTWVGYKIVVI